MPPVIKSSRSKAVKKTAAKKGLGKGAKVFIGIFGMALLVVVLLMMVNLVNSAITAAKSVKVNIDMEIGGEGDGPGQFKEPWGVALDTQGNFYVTDFQLRRIQKFDPTGKLLLTFGEPGKEAGQFDQPSGLWVASNGNIYVCDTFNHRVQEFDPDGKVLKVWSQSFFGPRSIVGDEKGHLFVSDTGNHKIKVFDMEGNYLTEWGGLGTPNGKFQEPMGLTVDPEGFVYVADSDNRRIQKFDANGKFISSFRIPTWGGKNVEEPYLACGQGFLYATNASHGTILKYDMSGRLVCICEKGNKEGFVMATGVAVDGQGRIYVIEKTIDKVARFTIPAPSGK